MHGLLAEFDPRSAIDQCRKASGAQWDSQHDAVITAEKDVGNLFRRSRNPLNDEPFPEQRLAGIDYLGPLDASVACRARMDWVVEVGAKKCCGLTRSITSG